MVCWVEEMGICPGTDRGGIGVMFSIAWEIDTQPISTANKSKILNFFISVSSNASNQKGGKKLNNVNPRIIQSKLTCARIFCAVEGLSVNEGYSGMG